MACPSCGDVDEDDDDLEFMECCGLYMCWRCAERHEAKYKEVDLEEQPKGVT